MLTAERIELFKTMLINNQIPTNPEDTADFEIVKAMVISQATAGQSVPVNTVPAANPAVTATNTAPATNLVPAATTSTPPAAPVASDGSAFTMEEAMKSSMAVDSYLKVKYGQTFINEQTVSDDPIYVSIDLDSIVVKSAIKAGNPVKYYSTLNGKDCLQGGSWADVVADMQKMDPKARPYFCVDLAMKVAQDIKAFNGQVIMSTGNYIGHTTATTNWKDWSRFYQALPTHSGCVFVKLTRQNVKKNNNSWGLLNFEYVNDAQAQALGLVG